MDLSPYSRMPIWYVAFQMLERIPIWLTHQAWRDTYPWPSHIIICNEVLAFTCSKLRQVGIEEMMMTHVILGESFIILVIKNTYFHNWYIRQEKERFFCLGLSLLVNRKWVLPGSKVKIRRLGENWKSCACQQEYLTIHSLKALTSPFQRYTL